MIEYSEIELKNMSDNDIREHFLLLRSNIITRHNRRLDTKNLEVYYCYVCKEIQSRK